MWQAPIIPRNNSLQYKPLSLSADHHFKVSWFGDSFVVAANEREILPAQLEIQRAALPRFQIDFCKTSQTLTRRRYRSYQITNVELSDFLSGAPSCIGQSNTYREILASGNRLLAH